MKPSTEKMDKQVWKLYRDGIAPKDIAAEMNITASQVSMGLYRQRRARGVPLMVNKRRKTKINKRQRR